MGLLGFSGHSYKVTRMDKARSYIERVSSSLKYRNAPCKNLFFQ